MTMRRAMLRRTIVAVLLLGALSQTFADDGRSNPIPYKKEAGTVDASLSKLPIGLIVCAIAAVGAVYFIRRRFGLETLPQSERQLRVLESRRLDPRLVLYVVEFSGQRHLIAHSEHGVSTVASSPSPVEKSAEETT